MPPPSSFLPLGPSALFQNMPRLSLDNPKRRRPASSGRNSQPPPAAPPSSIGQAAGRDMDEGDCHSTQLIDASGEFNAAGLDAFVREVRLADCGLSYAVVSIMGPQGSGKSTLLNHLFGTNFQEMDALKGRNQTTKGIWIAKSISLEPCTVVMDLEGTDGRERGEDDTVFEKQSALFALAVSDIVLINIWCHDIGREHAANRPLLKTVFQVMMRLFSPRKSVLLFVIRDKTKTPLDHLESILKEDIQKIWDAVPKPQAHKETPLSEFFNVEVTALPSYEEKEEQFKEQVAQLRHRFFHSIAPGGLAGDRRGAIPGSAFSFSAHQIWKVIQENKDLDLPAHKIMVATVRCEEIATEIFNRLASDARWLELEEVLRSGPVPGFGKKLSSILDTYLSEYEREAMFFDEGVRTSKRHQLESRALHFVHPAFQAMLGHLRTKALEKFKNDLHRSLKNGKGYAASVHDCTRSAMHDFEKGCLDVVIKHTEWDTSKSREKLSRDIEAHAASVRSSKLSELKAALEKQLTESLAEPVESLFDAAGPETWPSMRKLYKHETEKALSRLSSSLSEYGLDQETYEALATNLKDYAKSIVEKKAREQAGRVLIHMKDRFSTVFSHGTDSMPRVWTGKEDILKITKNSNAAALKVLSVMAAIRLHEKPDNIENILRSSLINGLTSEDRSIGDSTDPLASSRWEEVPAEDTLITPVHCKSIWRQFKTETEYIISQAISAQVAHKRSNSWLPPPWAIVAIAILGFNEFMMLLRNPLYILVLFVLFLLSKAVWVQLNITEEFRNGTLSGIHALSSRFLPTVMNILRKLAAKGLEENQIGPTSRQSAHLSAQVSRSQMHTQGPLHSLVIDSSSSSLVSSNNDMEYMSPLRRRQVGETDTESNTL